MSNSKAPHKTLTVVTLGVLVAMHIILSRFLSINAWHLKIGFTFVPVFVAACCFGPVAAGIVGGLGDFLGAILFPIGPYFPGFTLTCALTGVIYGLFFYKKQTWPRILTAVLVNQFGISLFITTLWISILYGSAYWPLLVSRVGQCLILAPLEFVVMMALVKPVAYCKKGVLA